MSERRRETRIRTGAPLWVYDRKTHRPIGRLEDVTAVGIKLTSDGPIQPDTILSCKIPVPKEVSKAGTITFDARSIWSHKDPHSNAYHTGFELLNVIRAEIERLKRTLVQDTAPRPAASRTP
jgi:hypothetical protein